MGKHKLMDQMDIDCVLVVPDTPTRLPAKNAENSSGVNKEIDTSLPSLSGQGNFSTEQHKTQLNNATGIRRLFIHHPRRHGSGNSECHANSSSSFTHYPSSSSRNDNLFARKDTSFSNCEEKDSGCVQFIKKDSTDSNPGLSSCKDSLHLMERSMPAQVLSGSSQGEGFSKRKVSSNGFSNLLSMKSSSETSNVDKEKQFDDGYKVGLNMLNGVRKEFVHDTQHNDKKDVSASLITLPRVTRQKRLVRNGCISPHNIAKAKKPVGRDHNDPLTVKQNYSSPVSSSSNSKSQINVKDLVSEGHASNTMKGKGIMVHPFTLTGLNEKNGHTSFRNVIAIDEEVTEITGANQDAFRSFEESGGWRSTRNHYQKSLSDEDHHLSLGNDINACSETKHNQHKLLRRENGTNAQSHDHYPNCEDLSSHRYPSARTSSQVARPFGQQLSHIDMHQPVINPLGKRQKQGSTSINNAECSTSAFNDTDIIFSDSFKDPNNNSRENTNQNCSRRENLESTIEIDDLSPQATNDGSGGVACCRSDEDARARQVEADEVLALELQEQLFNEMPVFGVDEIDEHVARALHQEDFHHAFSGDTRHRGRSFANERRHSQFQSSINVSRRAPQASSSNRLARWRSRFPGQPRTLLSSTGRNSIFPSYMDVETRMEVLETLEAFSNIGVYGDFLQTQRDFNENDYEMLLALDENNHQHAGAPMHQINGLPESTVQNENLEEACAICLENPTMGETIRHLPCLHKFHKDCIDPWLQRRSSCPVCKSSIT